MRRIPLVTDPERVGTLEYGFIPIFPRDDDEARDERYERFLHRTNVAARVVDGEVWIMDSAISGSK